MSQYTVCTPAWRTRAHDFATAALALAAPTAACSKQKVHFTRAGSVQVCEAYTHLHRAANSQASMLSPVHDICAKGKSNAVYIGSNALGGPYTNTSVHAGMQCAFIICVCASP